MSRSECLIPSDKAVELLLRFCFAIIILLAVNAYSEYSQLSETLLNQVRVKYGQRAHDRLLDWQELINTNKDKTIEEKLRIVNNFFNKVKPVEDIDHWGKEDYWATPVELLSTNGGDCEDYSSAKYFTLKELGVPVDRLFMTYVKAIRLNVAHMVLTYYETPQSVPLVLDNLNKKIRPASRRGDLAPVYSFNGDGLWLAKERGKGLRVGGSGGINLWSDLGLRMKREEHK